MGTATASIITVDNNAGSTADFTSIQAAVDAASPGDMILVYPGTYYENVDVYKTLNISSTGGASETVVIASYTDDNVFYVSADDTIISGFTVKGATDYGVAGIRLYSSSCTLANNIVSNNGFGIILEGSSVYAPQYNTIKSNTISDNYRGIRVGSSRYTTVMNNMLSNNFIGFSLYLFEGSTITNNTVIDSNLDIDANYLFDNFIYNNYFSSSRIDSPLLMGVLRNNAWNTPKTAGLNIVNGPYIGGNCWVRPDGTGYSQTCTDGDGDGICDSPYYLLGGNIDYLPLVYNPNQAPLADANGPYDGYEGSIIIFDASTSSDPDGNALQYRWDFDNDGIWDTEWSENPTAQYTWNDNLIGGTAMVEVSDGLKSATATATVTVNNVAPSIISIENIPVDPVPVGTTILPTATFTDPGTLDTHNALWDWDGFEEPSPGNVEQNQDSVTGSHIYNTPGIYTIKLTVTDDDGGSDTVVATHYLIVYDSEGGFATGGGWIDSSEGAYTPQPSLTGKANFGFVSKYKKGATTPTGQTEFQFKVADLNFHSDTYDWLVIAGHKAIYKGTGTINGEGNFGFLLSAVDEALTPSTNVDLFRIKIWNKENNDAVVYDNQIGDDDDTDPTTGISHGSITIHKNK